MKDTIKIYWQHCQKYKTSGIILIIVSILGAVLATVTPLFYKKFFDVFARFNSTEYVTLLTILGIIALLGILEKLIVFATIESLSKFENDTMIDLMNHCFENIHRHSFGYFNNSFSGAIVKKVNQFSRSFEIIVDHIFFQIFPSILLIVAITAMLFYKNIYLGGVILLWLLFMLVFNWKVMKRRQVYDKTRNEAESSVTADLSDTIVNHSTIRLFNGYNLEKKKFIGLNEKVRLLRLKSWRMHGNSDLITGSLSLVLNIILMYVGIRLWQQGRFTVGDFVMLQSYALMIINRSNQLGNVIRKTHQAFTDASEMTEILKTEPEISNIARAKKLKILKGAISFTKVEFYYQQTRQVLNNFNLDIKPGEKLALIGASGAGKTTIVNLLLRNFDIDSGQIAIDGQDISKVTLESLRGEISLVPQDPILFHRSLKENIAYGRPEASDKEIYQAAKLANCHQFISGLAEGYETMVGERGVKLSGGERQRVAIARAILRNAPILILDEATSSLDSASEELIQEALNRLMKNKTVIVIAHRLSTIKKMDRIVFLDERGIVESGKHEELIKQEKSLYRKLWEKQSSGFLRE